MQKIQTKKRFLSSQEALFYRVPIAEKSGIAFEHS